MKRTSILIVAGILVLIPIIIAASMNWKTIKQSPWVMRLSPQPRVSSQYTASAKAPGFKMTVADTAFLENVAATMKLFTKDAIADPTLYFGNKLSTKRYTVSQLRFELVPVLDQYIVGLGGSNDFAARGVYTLEGDTLVVRVSLDEAEVKNSQSPGQYMMEDIYLDAALQTLVYATRKPGQQVNPMDLSTLAKAVKDNVLTGVFQRPIRIEKTQP